MANICGHCKSDQTQFEAHSFKCLECGEHTDPLGRALASLPSADEEVAAKEAGRDPLEGHRL
jgi:hypothetical protein